MNKLYFRAWLKDEKRMVYAKEIDFYREFREACVYDENFVPYSGEIGVDFDIMQGIEIDGQVVYEGDIVVFEYRGITGYKGIKAIRSKWLISSKPMEVYSMNGLLDLEALFNEGVSGREARNLKIIGNIYENK